MTPAVDAGEIVPPERIPGLKDLARALMGRDPAVQAFLPDRWDLETIGARAREVLARFSPRDPARSDPALADLAAGTCVAVVAGQQVGVCGGPLLTLVKALAAVKLAGALRGRCPASPLFWCASEDHDLAEITRFSVDGPGGVVDLGPDAASLAANRRPVGALPVGVDVAALLDRAAEGVGSPDAETREALVSFHSGRTYREAFVATVAWLAGDSALRFADAAREADKADLVPLATRVVLERAEVRRLLAERNAALEKAGHPLQVRNDPSALPLFALVSGERFALREAGGKLVLKGSPEERAFSPEEVVSNFASGAWHPSFSALTRPLAASVLYPVAASILGPAEIAYWAQSFPLFSWAGIVPPVVVPRPFVAPLPPPARRTLARLGLSVADVLEGEAALLRKAGEGRARGTLDRVREVKAATLAALEPLGPELLALDPSLARALDATRKNVAFALEKLEEKAAQAAGRGDELATRQVRRLAGEILPGGTLAERVYTAVPWLLRFGREGLVPPLKQALRWDVPGLQVIPL
jgi:bacillithiol biosynthesis cysteine-adding enzyme BshC